MEEGMREMVPTKLNILLNLKILHEEGKLIIGPWMEIMKGTQGGLAAGSWLGRGKGLG